MGAPAAAAVLKRTPLYGLHRELGARMVDFGGWEMPVQYAGILEEHRAVRERVGLFDVSHMGELDVEGPDALDALQALTPNDVSKLEDGRIHYSAFLTERGTFVDDLLVYRRAPDSYLVVVNASNTPKDFDWARERATGQVRVADRSADYALIAVQGPKSAALLSRLSKPDPSDLPYYGFRDTEVAGAKTLVSRTGYTGEDGFELYFDATQGEKIWDELFKAGEKVGLKPIGLGARDTLRLEMAYCLYGNDIDRTTHPLEAGLGWTVKLDKDDFCGKAALEQAKAEGLKRRLVGLEIASPRVARHGWEVAQDGAAVGEVTSGTSSPTLGRSIALAYVPATSAKNGTAATVRNGTTELPARVVPRPFYTEASHR